MKRLTDKIVELLNFRIKAELESAYLYEQMANCLEMKGYKNGAKLWRKDASDEREHAHWAMDYMLANGVEPITPTINVLKQDYKGLKDIVDKTVEHEFIVTKQCNELAKAALLDNDLMTHAFVADKYLKEQIEEQIKVLEYQRVFETFGDCIDAWVYLEGDIFASKI